MKKPHFAVVIVAAGTHFAYLLYLPSGGFLALRWPRTLWLHLACVGWGVAVVTLALPCPLTSLEGWARARAGMRPLPTTGFIDRYIAGVVYPAGRTGIAQALAFGAAATSWAALARKQRDARRAQRAPHECTARELVRDRAITGSTIRLGTDNAPPKSSARLR